MTTVTFLLEETFRTYVDQTRKQTGRQAFACKKFTKFILKSWVELVKLIFSHSVFKNSFWWSVFEIQLLSIYKCGAF